MRLHLTLPLPPSVNHCYRRYTTKNGRRMNVMTKTATDWVETAQDIAKAEMRRTGWVPPQGEKVVIEYTVMWPDRRRRDPSNLEKLLLDGICARHRDKKTGAVTPGIIMDDDQWALPRCIDFGYDKDNPRIEVDAWRKE